MIPVTALSSCCVCISYFCINNSLMNTPSAPLSNSISAGILLTVPYIAIAVANDLCSCGLSFVSEYTVVLLQLSWLSPCVSLSIWLICVCVSYILASVTVYLSVLQPALFVSAS